MDNNEVKKAYIISYNESVVDDNGYRTTTRGIFPYSYRSLDEAKAVVVDCGMKKAEELDINDELDIDERWNEEKTRLCLIDRSNSYAYEIAETILI